MPGRGGKYFIGGSEIGNISYVLKEEKIYILLLYIGFLQENLNILFFFLNIYTYIFLKKYN